MNTSDSEEALIARLAALPAAKRQACLEATCAENPSLSHRLPSILAAVATTVELASVDKPASPLADPAVQALRFALLATPVDEPGTRVGHYKLLQKIGEGGFGVVWMAEQHHPIRRRVAVKIIKIGMDTEEVIARFEVERQALALMEHPNIAHVFDAGATEAGRPYFVMELVRGLAITRYCDENRLSAGARLRLFVTVCQAVQHAHQKGVIHRDLKPSNILVTLHDGVPVPKIIDFGIAKATSARLSEKTLFTQFHTFIGTPAYTSPEQMEMSGLDIDTRSDVYSLGVLLYELLTGQPPFDSDALVKSGLEAMRRTIRETDPPRPSHRLSTLSEGNRSSVAHHRGTDAGKLSLLLRGDLDWIAMRCLEKDRTRRYDSATALAADIERHLSDGLVEARPPSRIYQARKFIRRHRVGFVSATALALALVAGTIASSWQAVRAVRAERIASREGSRAVEERARAEDLLTFMLGDLRAQLAKVGRLDVLEGVGDKAMAYFGSLNAADLNDPMLARHAKALTQIGEIRMAQARYADATAAFAAAYDRAAALATRHPQDGDVLFERGQAEYWNGFVHFKRGELDAAGTWLTRYRNTFLALAAMDPARRTWQSELANSQQALAVLRQERGELDAARADFLAELATREKMLAATPGDLEIRFLIADLHSWLGGLAEQQGDFGEALKQYVTQTTQLTQLAEAEPATARWRFWLANALLYQTDVHMTTGRFALAGERLSEARRLINELVAHDAANRRWLAAALNSRLKEALLARQQGNFATALRLVHELRPQLENLSAAEPTDRKFALWLAKALRLEAQVRPVSDLPDAATAALRATELGEKRIREHPVRDAELGECALACVVSGEIAASAGDNPEARRHWQRAADLLAPRLTDTRDWRLLDPAARAAAWLGRSDEALALIARLASLGYIPLDPWPTADESPAVPTLVPSQPLK